MDLALAVINRIPMAKRLWEREMFSGCARNTRLLKGLLLVAAFGVAFGGCGGSREDSAQAPTTPKRTGRPTDFRIKPGRAKLTSSAAHVGDVVRCAGAAATILSPGGSNEASADAPGGKSVDLTVTTEQNGDVIVVCRVVG